MVTESQPTHRVDRDEMQDTGPSAHDLTWCVDFAEPHGLGAALPLPTRLASLRLRRLPEQIPWEEASSPLRSDAGLNAGVYFFRLAEQDVVTKLPEHPERELAAARAARLLNLRAPQTRLEVILPAQVRDALPAYRGSGVLVMQRVPGHHFGELTRADIRDLRLGTPRGQQLYSQLGRVLAYDYLIGNPDRFPAPGLGGHNTGNLMLCGDLVWCIDSTLPTPNDVADADWLRSFHRGQNLLFDLARAPARDPGRMAEFTRFFDAMAPVGWPVLGRSLLQGAAVQCRLIAGANAQDFEQLLVPLTASAGGLQLAGFMRDNLGRFRSAFSP